MGWEIIVLQIRLVVADLNPAMLEPMDWDSDDVQVILLHDMNVAVQPVHDS